MSPVPAPAARPWRPCSSAGRKETCPCRRLSEESSRRRPMSRFPRCGGRWSEPADAGRATAAATCAGGAAIAAARGDAPAAPGGKQEPTLAPPRGAVPPPAKPAADAPPPEQIGPAGAGGFAADQAPGESSPSAARTARLRRRRRRRRPCTRPWPGRRPPVRRSNWRRSCAARGRREWNVRGNAEGDSPIFVGRKSGQSPGKSGQPPRPADEPGRMPPNCPARAGD